MAYDRLAQESRLDKLAHALSRHRGIVGDHRQIAFLLPHDLVDETLGRAHGHETADHETCPVRNSGDCLLERDGLHCPLLRLVLRPDYGGARIDGSSLSTSAQAQACDQAGYEVFTFTAAGQAPFPEWRLRTNRCRPPDPPLR